MRTRTETLLVAAALLGAAAVPLRGQNPAIDPRWTPFLGCWEASVPTISRVCVVPAGAAAVDLVTITNGQVAAREHIAATGERQASTRDNCPGWESAQWSALGQRVYLRSEYVCADGATRGASGLIAMSAEGQWLFVQGAAVAGRAGIRVLRYWEALTAAGLPSEIVSAPRLGVAAVSEARALAGASLTTEDIVEASRYLDTSVLEAWLAERGESFAIDGRRLVALANAGVPSSVIDLMVALSYPRAFTINTTSRQVERQAVQRMATYQTGGGGGGPARLLRSTR